MRGALKGCDAHFSVSSPRIRPCCLWVLAVLVCILGRSSCYGAIGSQLLVDLPGGDFTSQMYTGMQRAAGRPNDLFVSRADGNIFRVDLTTNTQTPFLTLPPAEIDAGGGYWGLLGFTFAPDFATSGNLYVHVADDLNEDGLHHRVYVRQYTLTNPLSNSPTLSAPKNLLRWDQGDTAFDPNYGADHSGGWLGFQPGDPNTLWITSGDTGNQEGSGRDRLRTGQDPTDLRASILRIDVSGAGAGEFGNYAIPSNNPNATGAPQFSTWAPEVWSIGLRSPWGGSFDRATGDFYVGDVGSSRIGGNTGQEEIDFERADSPGGRNYGWRIMEGTTCPSSQDAGVSCNPNSPDPSFTPPVYDYEYGGGYGSGGAPEFAGRSVTGGYVYRGPIAELQGKYIFGDWASHQTWAIEVDRNANGGLGGVVPGSRVNLSTALERPTAAGTSAFSGQTAFSEDEAGNLYYLDLGGGLYKICENCGPEPPPTPTPMEPLPALRDNFTTSFNYQTGNVPAGGIWTATHNAGFGDTFNANTSNAGQLTIGMEPVGWQGGGADNGPFLFREVSAESLLEVRVKISTQTRGNWSSAGILIRADGPLDNDASNDNYLSAHSFRTGTNGNDVQISNVIGGSEGETTVGVTEADLMFLRLVNKGNGDFEIFNSSDGTTWTSRGEVTNDALGAGLLEVGLWAGNYGGGSTAGTTTFDWAEIIVGVPAGDYNENGVVDTADYTTWRNTLGQPVTKWQGADGDGDGMVTAADYDVWRKNYGLTIPNLGGSGGLAGVPEPGSGALVLFAAIFGTYFYRRPRHRPGQVASLAAGWPGPVGSG